MGASPAQMRATWMKLAISQAKRLPDADRALRAVTPELRSTIREASIVGWLPAADFAALADAFALSLGEAGARALWREAMLRGFDRPLLRPLIDGAFAIYGKTPASIFKMSPRGWALVARDAGVNETQALSERSYRVSFRHLPPELRSGRGFVTVCMGNCDAALRRFQANGTVRADDSRLLAEGTLSIDVTWTTGATLPPPA